MWGLLIALVALSSCSSEHDYYKMGANGSFFSSESDLRLMLYDEGRFIIASETRLVVENGTYRFDDSTIYFSLKEIDEHGMPSPLDPGTVKDFSCKYRVDGSSEKSDLYLLCQGEKHKLVLSPGGREIRYVNSINIKVVY